MKGTKIKIGKKGAKVGMFVCWVCLAICLYQPILDVNNLSVGAVILAVADMLIPVYMLTAGAGIDDVM